MTETTSTSSNKSIPKLIAFYLTQFHPIPENDAWWGKGFTEWTNVTKSSPLFKGHYQPHLPSHFGFYDLRVKETRHEQIKTAKKYGIDGFCYHYYWFSGKRLLNRPLDEMLADPESDMPFCLCWANENWSRRWDAAEHEVLVQQKYLPTDDRDFIESLGPFLRDPRYIRVDGKPLLIIYRPQHLPNAPKSVATWRQYCHSNGIGEIHICAALTHGNQDYLQFGFDSGAEFPPHNISPVWMNDSIAFQDSFEGGVCDYSDIATSYLDRTYDGLVYKSVFPSWDNTARRKHRSLVILNGTPENYEYWLSMTIDLSQDSGNGDSLIFINAWNEWAEGCHLEPDALYGSAFLDATLSAKTGIRRFTSFSHIGPPSFHEVPEVPSLAEDVIILLLKHAKRKFHETRKFLKQRSSVVRRLRPLAGSWRRLRNVTSTIRRSNDEWLRGCMEPLIITTKTQDLDMEQVDSGNEKSSLVPIDSFSDYVIDLRESYLQLVQSTLTGIIYEDRPLLANTDGNTTYDPNIREYGWDWPSKAFTMVGSKRLLNFRHLIENTIANNIPGDIVETGVWRGGACILARAVLKVYDQRERNVVLCDSFEGLPAPNVDAYPADAGSKFHEYPELAVSLDQVKENFRRFNLLDDQVVFVKGFFKDTLSTLPCKEIAVLRLDGDMYESTIGPMRQLYDKISPQGWVIIDDYEVVPACKQAVHDFFEEIGIDPALNAIDGVGRFFQKP